MLIFLYFILGQFINEPQTITVAKNDNAYFLCYFDGIDSLPTWIINDTFYNSLLLPPNHEILHLNGIPTLRVNNVQVYMNLTTYQCVIIHNNEEVYSNTAVLYVGKYSIC